MSAAATLTPSLDSGCPSCHSPLQVSNGIEQFCGTCGVVFDHAPVVVLPSPLSLSPSPPSTVKVRAAIRNDLFRAQRTATHLEPYRHEWENRLAVQKVGQRLDAPTVIVERAGQLYRVIRMSKRIPRQGRFVIAGVAYVIAYREFGIARSIRDIAKAAEVDKFFLGRRCRHIGRKLGLAVTELSPEAYLRTFLERLGWDAPRRARTLEALSAYRAFLTTQPNRCPSSPTMATAAIAYVAATSEPRVTWRVITGVTGLTDVTLRVLCNQVRTSVRRRGRSP